MKILGFVSYLGTFFQGWQKQKKGERTVQETIENALEKIYKKKVKILGAGRTDAGVHAKRQAFHFSPPFEIPESNLVLALNSILPWDIKILSIHKVHPEFNAKRDVLSKVYLYRLKAGKFLYPFEALFFGKVEEELNFEKMKEAMNLFLGEKDFYKFTVSKNSSRSTIRTIIKVKLLKKNDKFYFLFEGKGFLRYQVRRMVGTLIEIGKGKRDIDWLLKLFERESNEIAGPPIEPKGLFLLNVKYPKEIFKYGKD